MKTDEFFDKNKFLTGCIIVVIVVIVVVVMGSPISVENQNHDPEKMLKLRSECLQDDRNITSAYCDDIAEKYSRIAPTTERGRPQ